MQKVLEEQKRNICIILVSIVRLITEKIKSKNVCKRFILELVEYDMAVKKYFYHNTS